MSLLNKMPPVPPCPSVWVPKFLLGAKCPSALSARVPKRPSSARVPRVPKYLSALSARVPLECPSVQVALECPLSAQLPSECYLYKKIGAWQEMDSSFVEFLKFFQNSFFYILIVIFIIIIAFSFLGRCVNFIIFWTFSTFYHILEN